MVAPPAVHSSVLALKQQGDKAYVARDFAAAVERYSEALESVEDVVVLSNRSATHAQRRRFDKALVDADRALKLQPGWPRLHHRRGHALFHLGRYSEAIRAFEAGVKLDPEDGTLRDALGKALVYTEPDPNAPAPSAASAARKRPGSSSAGVAAGAAPMAPSGSSSGAPAAAATTATAPGGAGSGGSPSADELREKGNTFFRQGKHSSAVRAYTEALELSPDPKLWANRAAAQMEMLKEFGKGQSPEQARANPYYQNAMQDLEKSLSADPRYVKAWARKGQLYCMGGEVRQAMTAYERGLAIDPASKDCQTGKDSCLSWLASQGN